MTNMTNREKRNLRRVSMLVTAQTLGNLEKLATMAGYGHDLAGWWTSSPGIGWLSCIPLSLTKGGRRYEQSWWKR